MSKINTTSSDHKSSCTENNNIGENISKRYCENCKKEFIFKNIIGEYPELFQDPITTLWMNSKVKFYCSYCLILKIIKLIKKNKKNQS